MTGNFRRKAASLTLVLALAVQTLPAVAQGLFDPVARVGDSAVTRWERDQRAQFLTLFRTPGDVQEIAMARLIDEKLQRQEAERTGLALTEEQVLSGMEEFAARANLTLDEFIMAIGDGGVSEEAFRDFVIAGLLWRELIRVRFGEVARPGPSALDDRLTQTGTEAGTRVLLYEIVLPGNDPATYAASRERAAELASIDDPAAFRAAARQFSTAPSNWRGGELDWRVITALPPEVQPAVSAMRPGQTSAPVFLERNVVLFHMRDREELPAVQSGQLQADYAILQFADPSEAARAVAEVQTCNELYAYSAQAGSEMQRTTATEATIGGDVGAALARLDPGEAAVLTAAPGTVVMLCDRKLDVSYAASREAVGQALLNENLGRRAERLLAELRAKTEIVRFE